MGLKNFTKKRLFWCLFLRTTANDCFFLTFCTSNLVYSTSFRYNRKSKIFWANGEKGGGNPLWGRCWLGFGLGVRALLLFWLTEWVWIWVDGSFGGSPIQPSKEISFENLKDRATPGRLLYGNQIQMHPWRIINYLRLQLKTTLNENLRIILMNRKQIYQQINIPYLRDGQTRRTKDQ